MNVGLRPETERLSVANRQGTEPAEELGRILARKVRRTKRQKIVLGLGFPVALLCLWQAMTAVGILDDRFFPPPLDIMAEMVRYVTEAELRGELGGHLLISGQRLGTGYLLGVLSGLVVGLAVGLYQPIRFAVRPLLFALYPLPKMSIFPLIIVLLGIGEASKIALIALGTFYLVSINTITGIIYSPPIYRDVIKAFRIPTLRSYWKVMLPSALPTIFVGLKIGFGNALIMLVTGEFLAAKEGVGWLIWMSWQVLEVPRMFVALTCLVIVATTMTFIYQAVERKLMPWATN